MRQNVVALRVKFRSRKISFIVEKNGLSGENQFPIWSHS